MQLIQSNDPRFSREPKKNYWTAETSSVPMYDLQGEVIGHANLTWNFCNVVGHQYEITDVVYSDLNGMLPEHEDIIQAIQDTMGLTNVLIFAGKFTKDNLLA